MCQLVSLYIYFISIDKKCQKEKKQVNIYYVLHFRLIKNMLFIQPTSLARSQG